MKKKKLTRRIQLQQIRKPQCSRCELSKTTDGNICVMGRGNARSPIMLIGEAPGEAEARTDRPFMGRSGQLLQRMIDEVGITEDVYITNGVRCRPPENRTPTNREYDACHKFLVQELKVIDPRVIVVLSAPTNKFMTKGRVTIRHEPLVLDQSWLKGRNYIFTWHPAYVLRSGSPTDFELLRSLQIAKDIGVSGINYPTTRGFFEFPEIHTPRENSSFDEWHKTFQHLADTPGVIYDIFHPEYRTSARVRHVFKSRWSNHQSKFPGCRLFTRLGNRTAQAWIKDGEHVSHRESPLSKSQQ